MLISVNWLKEYVALDISAEKLAEKLIMAGFEVEQITRIGSEWDNVVIGEITDIKRHPQAEKLSLTTVRAGEKTYSVVCGASNIKTGQKVPLALYGASLPTGIKIKTSKIRGEVSQGMLCSEKELGLGDDTSGIMILSPDLATGVPLADSISLADTMFDINITPNRPDCLSVIGLAREIAAILDLPFTAPEVTVGEEGDFIENITSVEICDPDLCPRYTARIIANITIAPSPLWMRRRLETSGIRSINNAVDVTNYVLLEWGQPLHAFDFDLLKGHRIIVKRSIDNEHFVTLDGTERAMSGDALMICDAERPVAIAGIMGGQNSEVIESTRRILLESAYFLPASIRQTSKANGLKTEASQRFEKGIDINSVIPALNRAASLMGRLCGGTIGAGLIDRYPKPLPTAHPIHCSVDRTRKIIGAPLTSNQIKECLQRLHMHVEVDGVDTLRVIPPSFRVDIYEPVDLIEEVARLTGYEHIPATYPRARVSTSVRDRIHTAPDLARDSMISRGFYEVINYSFINPEHLFSLNLPAQDPRLNTVRILNPLSEMQSILRTTLFPSLLLNLRDNLYHKNTTIKLFEISTVFFAQSREQLPRERKRIAGLLCGLRFGENWDLPRNEADFFDIKGCVETLMDRLQIPAYRFAHDAVEPFLNPQQCLSLIIDNQPIGVLGEVHPDVLEKFDIDRVAYVFDIDFDVLSSISSEQKVLFKPFPRHPAIYRDLALIVDETVAAGTVHHAILSFKNKLIEEVAVFDCFRGSSIETGKKSLAYRIKFQSQTRNLTDDEVNNIQDKLVSHLVKEVGAELRH